MSKDKVDEPYTVTVEMPIIESSFKLIDGETGEVLEEYKLEPKKDE